VVTTAFELADRFVDDACEADPILCTFLGVPGSDDGWGTSLGLEGLEWRRDNARRYRREIAPLIDSPDLREWVAARVMLAAFDEGEESYQQGDHFLDLRHTASSFQEIRSVFDVMRTETDEDWAALATQAATLVESGNLLLMGDRPIDRGDWVTMTQALIAGGQVALKAAQSRSTDGILEAGDVINQSCDTCHERYQRQ